MTVLGKNFCVVFPSESRDKFVSMLINTLTLFGSNTGACFCTLGQVGRQQIFERSDMIGLFEGFDTLFDHCWVYVENTLLDYRHSLLLLGHILAQYITVCRKGREG